MGAGVLSSVSSVSSVSSLGPLVARDARDVGGAEDVGCAGSTRRLLLHRSCARSSTGDETVRILHGSTDRGAGDRPGARASEDASTSPAPGSAASVVPRARGRSRRCAPGAAPPCGSGASDAFCTVAPRAAARGGRPDPRVRTRPRPRPVRQPHVSRGALGPAAAGRRARCRPGARHERAPGSADAQAGRPRSPDLRRPSDRPATMGSPDEPSRDDLGGVRRTPRARRPRRVGGRRRHESDVRHLSRRPRASAARAGSLSRGPDAPSRPAADPGGAGLGTREPRTSRHRPRRSAGARVAGRGPRRRGTVRRTGRHGVPGAADHHRVRGRPPQDRPRPVGARRPPAPGVHGARVGGAALDPTRPDRRSNGGARRTGSATRRPRVPSAPWRSC